MNHRERFAAVMNYEMINRIPVYFFGASGLKRSTVGKLIARN